MCYAFLLEVCPKGKVIPVMTPSTLTMRSKPTIKVTKELLEIRNRRTGDDKQSFLAKKENFVLAGGILYTVLYVLLILGMTSGTFGNSTYIDHAASNTFLDIGGECEEITDEPWILIFPNEDAGKFSMYGYNLPSRICAWDLYNWQHEDEVAGVEVVDQLHRQNTSNPQGESDAGRMYFAAPFETLKKETMT